MHRVILLGLLLLCGAGNADRDLRRSLDRTIVPQFAWQAIPLGAALDAWRDATGFNLHVHERALRSADVGMETRVTVNVRDVAAGPLLQLILDDAGGGVRRFDIVVRDEVVHATTTREARLIRAARHLPRDRIHPDDADVSRRLAVRLPRFVAEEEPLERALTRLAIDAEIPMHVDWQAFAMSGVERATPVTIKTTNLPVEKALDFLLDHAGGGFVEMDHVVTDGMLHVSTAETIAADTFEIRYDVGRFLAAADRVGQREEAALDLIELIMQTVEPHAWQPAGGRLARGRLNGDHLHITADRKTHAKIAKLLDRVAGLRY